MRFFSALDLKLAFRMLLRYPGLSAMAGIAIAFAIMAGAVTFEGMTQMIHPRIPLPEGDRIVAFQYVNPRTGSRPRPLLRDLRVWRAELESVVELGALRTVSRNLTPPNDEPRLVNVAELDVAALGIARTPARLGRLFTAEDDAPGAPPVVLLSYELWRERFGADPGVIGTMVELGVARATVIGVMPEGFRYPASGDVWTPLRAATIAGPGDAMVVNIFGRLAPGASLARANEEVTALTAGLADELHERYAGLTARVLLLRSAQQPFIDAPTLVALLFAGSNLPVILFLLLVCGNVALLMYARAATRESELVVRNALGASRGRIVGQLFAEALAVAVVAAVVGLWAATYALRWAFDVFQREVFGGYPMPFWMQPTLSPTTILYAAGLTTLGAVVAGVLPGLKVTRSLQGGLKQASAGGGGFRFGGVWTAVIVAQIAVTSVFPLVTIGGARGMGEIRPPELGSPAEDYLIGQVWLDSSVVAREARFPGTLDALETRLEGGPRVAGVSFAERGLGSYHPWRQVEVDGPSAPPRWDERGHRVGSARVAVDYFEVLGLPLIAGRGFQPSDLLSAAPVVVVNQAFVDDILGERNAVGTRIRYIALERGSGPEMTEPGPWLEIVGVVPTTGKMSGYGSSAVYHAAAPGELDRAAITVHVPGGAGSFTGPLMAAMAATDPELLVRDLMPLDRVTANERDFYFFWGWILTVTSAIVVLLSLGGIYSVMSVTVTQRTREIGLRIALGSTRVRVVGAVFRKPLTQIGMGVAAGGLLLAGLMLGFGEVDPDAREAAIFTLNLVLVALACSLACVVPTRRVLAIQPAEALRAE